MSDIKIFNGSDLVPSGGASIDGTRLAIAPTLTYDSNFSQYNIGDVPTGVVLYQNTGYVQANNTGYYVASGSSNILDSTGSNILGTNLWACNFYALTGVLGSYQYALGPFGEPGYGLYPKASTTLRAALSGLSDYTIEFYAFIGQKSAPQAPVLFSINNGGVANFVQMNNSNNSLTWTWGGATTSTSTNIINKNEWYHIAVTKSGSSKFLYVSPASGVVSTPKLSGTAGSSAFSTINQINIGNYYPSANFASNAFIKNFKFISGAKTNFPTPDNEPGTIAHFKFENSLADFGGTGRDFTTPSDTYGNEVCFTWLPSGVNTCLSLTSYQNYSINNTTWDSRINSMKSFDGYFKANWSNYESTVYGTQVIYQLHNTTNTHFLSINTINRSLVWTSPSATFATANNAITSGQWHYFKFGQTASGLCIHVRNITGVNTVSAYSSVGYTAPTLFVVGSAAYGAVTSRPIVLADLGFYDYISTGVGRDSIPTQSIYVDSGTSGKYLNFPVGGSLYISGFMTRNGTLSVLINSGSVIPQPTSNSDLVKEVIANSWNPTVNAQGYGFAILQRDNTYPKATYLQGGVNRNGARLETTSVLDTRDFTGSFKGAYKDRYLGDGGVDNIRLPLDMRLSKYIYQMSGTASGIRISAYEYTDKLHEVDYTVSTSQRNANTSSTFYSGYALVVPYPGTRLDHIKYWTTNSGSFTKTFTPYQINKLNKILIDWDNSYSEYKEDTSIFSYSIDGGAWTTLPKDGAINATCTGSFSLRGQNLINSLDASSGVYINSVTADISGYWNDINAPSSPSGAYLTGIAYNNINVVWDNTGNTNTAYTYVYRSTVNDINSGSIVNIAPYPTGLFSDSSVNSNTEYFYWLRNVSLDGDFSPYTSVLSGTTLQWTLDDLVQQQNAISSHIPQNVSVVSTTSGILLSWSPPASGTIYGYRIYRAYTYDQVLTPLAQISGLSYLDSGVQQNSSYYYRVTSIFT